MESKDSVEEAWSKQLILSLDAGGVRGYSMLLVLQKLMTYVEDWEKSLAEDDSDNETPCNRPCYYFDYIGGTGTGGLIAILLGRLRMTVDEAIIVYQRLGQEAFVRPRKVAKVFNLPAFQTERLESSIRDIMMGSIERGGDAEAFEVPAKEPCKTLVNTALVNSTATIPYLLRSYPPRENSETIIQNSQGNPSSIRGFEQSENLIQPIPHSKARFTVIQAVLATLASSRYIAPVVVDNETFREGMIGNNPSISIMREVERISWSTFSFNPVQYGVIINIGTGSLDESLFTGERSNIRRRTISLFSRSSRDIRSTEAYRSSKRIDDTNTKNLVKLVEKIDLPYFRFDVGQTYSNSVLDFWRPFSQENINTIQTWTNNYLEGKVSEELRKCAEILVKARRSRSKDIERWNRFKFDQGGAPSTLDDSQKRSQDDFHGPSQTFDEESNNLQPNPSGLNSPTILKDQEYLTTLSNKAVSKVEARCMDECQQQSLESYLNYHHTWPNFGLESSATLDKMLLPVLLSKERTPMLSPRGFLNQSQAGSKAFQHFLPITGTNIVVMMADSIQIIPGPETKDRVRETRASKSTQDTRTSVFSLTSPDLTISETISTAGSTHNSPIYSTFNDSQQSEDRDVVLYDMGIPNSNDVEIMAHPQQTYKNTAPEIVVNGSSEISPVFITPSAADGNSSTRCLARRAQSRPSGGIDLPRTVDDPRAKLKSAKVNGELGSSSPKTKRHKTSCRRPMDWAVLYFVSSKPSINYKRIKEGVDENHFIGNVPRHGSWGIAKRSQFHGEVIETPIMIPNRRMEPWKATWNRWRGKLDLFWLHSDPKYTMPHSETYFLYSNDGKERSGTSIVSKVTAGK